MQPRSQRRAGRRVPLPAAAYPRAAEMYAQGYSLAAVAEHFGTTVHWIKVAIADQGGRLRSPGGRTVPGRPFDLERAKELYAAGKTVRQIAELLGDSRCRVHTHLRAAGVPMRDMTAPRASRVSPQKRAAILAACRTRKPLRVICAELRTSGATVARVLAEAGIDREPLRRRLNHQRMRELRAQGLTYAAIGDELSTTAQYVWNVLNARQSGGRGEGSLEVPDGAAGPPDVE